MATKNLCRKIDRMANQVNRRIQSLNQLLKKSMEVRDLDYAQYVKGQIDALEKVSDDLTHLY